MQPYRIRRQYRFRTPGQPSQHNRIKALETSPMHPQPTETLQHSTSRTRRNQPNLRTRRCHLAPVHEPTMAKNVYNRSMEDYHEMDTEVTDIQSTYTAEHTSFTIANTTDRSRYFMSPELVEIFSNTPVEPIPTPPDHAHPITDKLPIFLTNI